MDIIRNPCEELEVTSGIAEQGKHCAGPAKERKVCNLEETREIAPLEKFSSEGLRDWLRGVCPCPS